MYLVYINVTQMSNFIKFINDKKTGSSHKINTHLINIKIKHASIKLDTSGYEEAIYKSR